MFNSRRKSHVGSNGLLPPTNPQNVNSNALAAASAIGNALKTGTPIPRSNSLQRTGSLQRSSFQNKSLSRSGSLLGLQTPPAQFRQHGAVRSHSLSSAPKPNPIARKPTLPKNALGKPRMIKKHVPGPYGLITIEVPAEEPAQQSRPSSQISRSSSLKKPSKPKIPSHSDNSSIKSWNSSASSRRPVFEEPLKEIEEDEPLNFEREPSPSQVPKVLENDLENQHNNDLTLIEEETTQLLDAEVPGVKEGTTDLQKPEESTQGTNIEKELESLKITKDIDEIKLEDSIRTQELEKQHALNREFPTTNFPEQPNPYLESSSDDNNDYPPSTSKSTETFNQNGSSFTTEESEPEVKFQGGSGKSMAQQLRPTIPLLTVNNKEPVSPSQFDLKQVSSNEIGTTNSSIYSGEVSENERIEAGSIPSRSEKRTTTPRKSALKIRSSTSSINLPDDKNPANAAYLSLTTAENTRLNALNNSAPAATRPRGSSFRSTQSPAPQFAAQQNNVKRSPQQQHIPRPQSQTGQRPSNSQQRPVSTIDYRQSNSKPPSIVPPQRPQSVQGFKANETPPKGISSTKLVNSMSVKPKPYKQQPAPSPQYPQANLPRSASTAAAFNASTKKLEPPKPQRSSSFEKERSTDHHSSAFKRKSLRDPVFNSNHTTESNMGFYRNQAQQQAKHNQAPPPQPQVVPHGNTSKFNSRFNDSDSDLDVYIGNGSKPSASANFNPPPPSMPIAASNGKSLRKPKSQFTLRSPSESVIPDQSPAKSLPEKRTTRYFSESDIKEQMFNEHKKIEAANNEKKKGTFGKKLKRLFGRSKE